MYSNQNDQKLKIVNFSELPKPEKTKYLNFFVDNDIQFTKDENGDYTTTIKIINPNYYKFQKTKESFNNNIEKDSEIESEIITKSKKEHTLGKIKPLSPYNPIKPQSFKDKRKSVGSDQKVKIESHPQSFNINNSKRINLQDLYSNITKYLDSQPNIKGKKLNYGHLKYLVEEVYSLRFIQETTNLKNDINEENNENENISFPKFVYDFMDQKYLKKNLIEQNLIDVLTSIDYYRANMFEFEIFHKFLIEEFNQNDLIFFLFVRSCIEKETKVIFIEKAKEQIKKKLLNENESQSYEIYLSLKNCLKIGNTIFGSDQEILLNSYTEKIESNLENLPNIGKNVIKASKILEITLEDYHNSKNTNLKTDNDEELSDSYFWKVDEKISNNENLQNHSNGTKNNKNIVTNETYN